MNLINIMYLFIFVILGLVGFQAIIQIILFFMIWLIYDRNLIKIREKIDKIPAEINQAMMGRGILRDEYNRQVATSTSPLKTRLELLEYKRKILIDRFNLISIIKFK